jgi:hypothetical protein
LKWATQWNKTVQKIGVESVNLKEVPFTLIYLWVCYSVGILLLIIQILLFEMEKVLPWVRNEPASAWLLGSVLYGWEEDKEQKPVSVTRARMQSQYRKF